MGDDRFVLFRRLFTGALTLFAAIGAVLGSAGCVLAQTDRSQSIRMLIGFSPGGGVDIVGRLVAQKLGMGLSASVIAQNVTGASGAIAATNASKAEPDGRTLLFVSSAHIMNAAVNRNLPYDAVKDFSPITEVAKSLNVIVVHPSLRVSTLGKLTELAKQRPGELFYGSGGIGTNSHMSTELLRNLAGIDVTHAPYKGASPFLIALISGEIHLGIGSLPATLPHIRSGRLVALAVTTLDRAAALPNVPTANEAGVPGYEYSVWYGLLAPAKTPADIIKKIRDPIVASLSDPDLLARFRADGAKPVGSTPQEFGALLKTEFEKWKKVVKTANIETK